MRALLSKDAGIRADRPVLRLTDGMRHHFSLVARFWLPTLPRSGWAGSSSPTPLSDKKLRSYWGESSGGLQGW